MYLSILALPLLGAMSAGFLGRKIGVTGAHIITCTLLVASALLSIVAFYEVGLSGSPVSIYLASWIDSESMLVNWGFLFDSLTVSMKEIEVLHSSHQINYMYIAPFVTIGKRWANIYQPKHAFPSTNCTAVVVWNNAIGMGSTIGYRTSHFVRQITGIPSYQLSVIVGTLLGDSHIALGAKDGSTARLVLAQSIINFPYLWHVWLILSPYCQSYPAIVWTHAFGKTYPGVQFKTRQYPCLAVVRSWFVVNGLKVVPSNIYALLTPVALAHWIMCDGARTSGGGLLLCTDSFHPQEVVTLMNVILLKWDVKSTLAYYNKKPRIYISRLDVLRLLPLVAPHMTAFSRYKLVKPPVDIV